jgi:hypothetical protein
MVPAPGITGVDIGPAVHGMQPARHLRRGQLSILIPDSLIALP